jgi:DNA-binding beta-propeller fold protein YncE
MRVSLPQIPIPKRIVGRGVAGAVLLTAAIGIRAASSQSRIDRPIMMDSNGPGTELYVLDSSGVLHEYRVLEKTLAEFGESSMPADFTPADMSFLRSETPASLLIAGMQSGRGAVIRLSLDSKTIASWNFQNVCSGVDASALGRTAYVATSDSNEVYFLDTKAVRSSFVTRIPSATKLGPLAFDEEHQRIYAADVANGQIYQYSIGTKTSKVIAARLSTPTALVFDADTKRLFVADPGQRAIFVIDTRASKPAAVRFASEPLKAPSGMTLLSNGRVAVADYSSNAIFVYSGTGMLLFRFP